MRERRATCSLFCGAGGLDMGFENEGFDVLWANDLDKDACATYENRSKATVVQGDVTKIDFSEVPDCDVLLGGFPCQGFSLAGPRRLDDGRNVMYRQVTRFLETKRPKIFICENVKGLLTMADGEILKAIVEDFKKKGYRVSYELVDAADYGVPQNRQRVIVCGTRDDLKGEFRMPKPDGTRTTLREALAGMPEPKPEEICSDGFSSRYMSRNRKRGWDEVSFTIPAMAKQVALHPSSPDMKKIGKDLWEFGKDGETRRLSWRECAVIQTFPREMEFIGNLTSKYRQIGNAVPVRLAQVVAGEVRKMLEENEEKVT